MKKIIYTIVIALFVVNTISAQTSATLDNGIIIKMVKAKLSDDLIIDEINNSKPNYILTDDSINSLSNAHVSSRVIQAMKAAYEKNNPAIAPAPTPEPAKIALPTVEIPAQSISVKKNDTIKKAVAAPVKSIPTPIKAAPKSDNNPSKLTESSTVTVKAISYVIPIEELMGFFDTEFNSLSGVIASWDNRVKDSTEKGNQIKETMLLVEKQLNDKKNSETKGSTEEIDVLKKKLAAYRGRNLQLKNNMVTEGKKLTTEIKDVGKKTDHAIKNKFKEISNAIKSVHPDPSKTIVTKTLTINKQKVNSNVADNVAPINEMLVYYQNQIVSLQDIVQVWNQKAKDILAKDSILSKQLEPVKQEMEKYKSDKTKTTELKKQVKKIEKDRTQLKKQMKKDSKELSRYLKKNGKEVQQSVKVRFNDIIENINYSYQDKF